MENNAVLQLGERRGGGRKGKRANLFKSRIRAVNEFQEDCQSFKIEMDD